MPKRPYNFPTYLLRLVERELLDREKRAAERRVENASFPVLNGSTLPYGYISKNKKLVPVPEEAKVVKLMYDIYAKKKSMAMVRNELEIRGIKTRSGKDWAKTMIHRILSNPIYARKLYENGKYCDGQHEAIIDPDLFFATSKTVPRIVHRKARMDRVFLLRGLARCDQHGCAMTLYYAKGRSKEPVYYYRCEKKQNHRKIKCPVAYTNADEIEGYVVGKIREIAKKRLFLKASEIM